MFFTRRELGFTLFVGYVCCVSTVCTCNVYVCVSVFLGFGNVFLNTKAGRD